MSACLPAAPLALKVVLFTLLATVFLLSDSIRSSVKRNRTVMKQKEFVKLFELSQEEEILYGTLPPQTPMLNGSIQIFECTLSAFLLLLL